jgi:hypothetical protein
MDPFLQSCSAGPETEALVGFPVDMYMGSQVVLNGGRFRMHSAYFISRLDRRVLGMVEAKQIEQNMKKLGAMLAEYGDKPQFFASMGEALVDTLKRIVGASGTSNCMVHGNMSTIDFLRNDRCRTNQASK